MSTQMVKYTDLTLSMSSTSIKNSISVNAAGKQNVTKKCPNYTNLDMTTSTMRSSKCPLQIGSTDKGVNESR